MTESNLPLVRIINEAGEILPGFGFYQRDDGTMLIPLIHPDGRQKTHNVLESESCRFHIDCHGSLILLEVLKPKEQWQLEDNIAIPLTANSKPIRWLNFRQATKSPSLHTEKDYSKLKLIFSENEIYTTVQIASEVIVGISAENQVAAICITSIVDDRAGLLYSKFIGSHYGPSDELLSAIEL